MHEIFTAFIAGSLIGMIAGGLIVNAFLHRIGAAQNVNAATDAALHQKVDQLSATVVSAAQQLAQHVTNSIKGNQTPTPPAG
jgi:uncharacterized protein YgfB (UPF0149 family)